MRKKIIIIAILFNLIILPKIVFAQNPVEVWEFGSYSCPYCQDLKAYLQEKVKANPLINYTYFELVGLGNQDNRDKLEALIKAYGVTDNGGVPKTFIGDRFIPGDDRVSIDSALNYCLNNSCKSPSQFLAEAGDIDADGTKPASQTEEIIGWSIMAILVIVVAGFGYKIIKQKK